MNPYQSKKFKDLQRTWYDKLKKNGFEDAEDTNSPKEYLRVWHSTYFQSRHSPESFAYKEEYYRMASSFLQTHLFKNDIERLIWNYHSEGLSIRDIVLEIDPKISRSFVHKIITSLSAIMLDRKDAK